MHRLVAVQQHGRLGKHEEMLRECASAAVAAIRLGGSLLVSRATVGGEAVAVGALTSASSHRAAHDSAGREEGKGVPLEGHVSQVG